MDHSTFDQSRIRSTADRALGHIPPLPRVAVDVPMAAAGGLYASADDVARFLRFQLGDGVIGGRTLLDPALMAEMRTVPAPRRGRGRWLRARASIARAGGHDRYVDLFDHNGGGFGFLADLWWLPKLQLGITVLTNSSDHHLQGDLAISVLRDLVTEPGSEYRERLLAQPVQGDVVDQVRFEPPDGMAALVAGAAMAPSGDEAERWAGYTGEYRTVTWGVMDPFSPADRFLVDDGVPTYETNEAGERVRHPLVEVEPGLFLADVGEMLDFRGARPTVASMDLVRVAGGPSPVSWAVLGAAAVAAVAWLAGGVVSWIRRRRAGAVQPVPARPAAAWWGRVASILATVAAVLVLATIALIVVLPTLVDSGFLGWLEFPLPARLALHLPLALTVAAAVLVVLGAVAWASGWWRPVHRPRLTVLTLGAAVLALQLVAWNLVGWGFG